MRSMAHMLARSACSVLAALALAACGGASRQSLGDVGAGLSGASGLEASVYARGVPQMSAFTFDAQGRLWVAGSGATTHAGDGVYLIRSAGSNPVKVIDSVRGPLGLAWIGDALYVSRLGGVDRFTGLHGTRFARRTTILTGPVRTAENNNLVVAPDGRLVLGVSATCDHCMNTPRYSGAIVSFRPDGSDLRIVANHVRAAYGLVYDNGKLYASMNQRDDLGAHTPGDTVAVITQGQDWRFPACYGQGGGACAGVPPVLGSLDAHAAAGGIAVAGDSVLVAEWKLGRVLSVPVRGGKATPWLAGIQHPLPLIRAADGSIFVGDWGTGVVYRVTGA